MIAGVTVITMITMFFCYRTLLFSTFDHEAARIFGVKTNTVEFLFSLLLTLSVIVSLNVVGVTMVAATLIAPAITARMLTDSFSRMIVLAILFGSVTGIVGMYLSYIFNVASGTTIVLFSTLVFSLSLMAHSLRRQ